MQAILFGDLAFFDGSQARFFPTLQCIRSENVRARIANCFARSIGAHMLILSGVLAAVPAKAVLAS